MAPWAPMEITDSEPAPRPDPISHRRRRVPPGGRGLLVLTGTVAAVALVVTNPAADSAGPKALFVQAPEPAAARPLPDTEGSDSAPGSVPSATESPSTAAAPPVRGTPTLDRSVLRLAGPVPSSGTGTFTYASSPGRVLGTAGALHRYRVAVEIGSEVDAEEVAAAVDDALGDPRSWTAGGRLRLQRVSARASHDFTIVLATANTAGRLCAAGGVNIRVGGRPYTSCRTSGKVILNLDRWQRSVDHLVAARVPLAQYRTYMVNHEVGHEFGYQHEGCPRRGAPAPVMMQQTLFLDGCVANPWPYPDGERYAGPPL
jgi:hypothetical protein